MTVGSGVKQWLRWLAPVAVIAGLLLVFRDELPFLGQAWDVLKDASPAPLAAAVCTALLAIAAMSGVMQVLLNTDARIANPANTNAIVFASNAWSTTVPGGPAISAWLTFRVHRSWGASVGLCGWFFVISGALSTVWMGVIGLSAVLFLGADLSIWTLLATFGIAAATIAAVFWATRNPAVMKRWIGFLPLKVRTRIANVIDQVATIRMGTVEFVGAAVLSLLNQLLDIGTMLLAVSAVGGHGQIAVTGVVLAFIVTKLAGAAQLTPGGVGTVEPVLAGMLVAGGLSLVDATAATIIYRTISFALVTLIGWITYALVYAGRGLMLGRK